MRNFIAAGAVVALAITTGVAGQGGCRFNTGFLEANNTYCDAVKHIHYTSVSQSGTYNKVINMAGCKTEPRNYNGPMAPFDEEVSLPVISVRTPLNVKTPHDSRSCYL